jgi:hypothetical protein
MPNPYSRAQWAELRLQFRPPRDGPNVSIRLRDYVTAEEINSVSRATAALARAQRAGARR